MRGFGIKKFPEDMDAVLELKQKQLNVVEKKQAKVKKTVIIISIHSKSIVFRALELNPERPPCKHTKPSIHTHL